jgi:hypothetical protein
MTARRRGHSSPGSPVPDTSGFVCKDLVCIQVFGSGLHVTEWYTQTNDVLPGECTWPIFWNGGAILVQGHLICNDTDESAIAIARWGPLTFSATVYACNTWQGVLGKPCVTIHR